MQATVEGAKKVVVCGAYPQSLINFRGELVRELVGRGCQVFAMAAPADEGLVARIESLGATYIPIPISRAGLNPLRDIHTYVAMKRVFRRLDPDILLTYTIKPNIWGGLAIAACPRTHFFALVTGIGYALQQAKGSRAMLRRLVIAMFRLALSRARRVIFQNPDNRDLFMSLGILPAGKCSLIYGSGVDLQRFACRPLPDSPPVFLVIARLLGDKGLREFASAAKRVKQLHPEASFRLVGPPDPSPDGIPVSEVMAWRDWVEYGGEVEDVRPSIEACHVYVLPSYHEGLPRTVIEAMAMGRAILTTDVPGCRETVSVGVNGFLVPESDAAALAERMIWFIDHPESIKAMAARSRQMAEERYDVRKINAELLSIMDIKANV